MNKRVTIATLLSGMAISMLIIIITVANTVKGQKNRAEKLAQESFITETQPAAIGYYLKEYNGELAVFRGESETPFKKLGVSVNVMSDYDRELLAEGIYAEDEKTLNILIEDYTS
ncbi:hypothetical protein [Porcipelethomonas sp.]|uniref:hypothetical protein n=1 Tax=Porcipelethomonas sp. TaxID=2981675 RepID=UPI003EF71E33